MITMIFIVKNQPSHAFLIMATLVLLFTIDYNVESPTVTIYIYNHSFV